MTSANPPPAPADLAAQLRDAAPAEILVFTMDGCPHCAAAVRAAQALAAACERITVAIVNAEQQPDKARDFRVQAVPTVVLDRELVLPGHVTAEELARVVLERGAPAHRQRVFESRLDAGDIPEAVRLVLDAPDGPACFARAWRASTMNTRMALLLAAERVLEADASALDGVVADLAAALRAEDAALRGDTADLLGQIGHPSAKEPLAALLRDPNPDVADIARDALAHLRPRS